MAASVTRSTKLIPTVSRKIRSASFAGDSDIIFPKRRSNLYSIFRYKAVNQHRITLEEWRSGQERNERNLRLIEDDLRSAHADLHQILGLFIAFQGVIITAAAQSSFLTCHNWTLPFFLCLLTSIFAFFASVQKLKEVEELKERRLIQRDQYRILRKSIEDLKEQGTDFNISEGQQELTPVRRRGEYYGPASSNLSGSDLYRAKIWRFCELWIINYAGAVVLLLFVFSGVTLFSIHQILCNPGMPKAT